ncbi:tannase/feruloyl esterase family alpha/beta hydrolase [Paraburkholderia jirisanensis]
MAARTLHRRILRALGCAAALCAAQFALMPLCAAQPQRCSTLTGLTLPPRTIALPNNGVTIDSATLIPESASGNEAGDYCRITGSIKAVKNGTPDIRFDLNLPSRWNGRALQLGGGGYNGVVVSGVGTMPFSPEHAPLAEGYATFGDDSGHVGNAGLAVFGLIDDAVINFGYAHLKKTRDAAIALITRAYGRAPDKIYFAGGSTGGREGYTVMQRFPDDYDGVIADSPALNFTGVRLIGIKLGQAEYVTPGGFVPPTLLDRVYQRSLAVCDKLDGAADGIVSDVPACRKREAEVLGALRCAPAARGTANPAASSTLDSTIARAQRDDKCLTDSQVATLMILRDGLKLPYRLAWDVSGYPGYNIFAGTRLTGGLGLGHDATRLAMPTFNANGYLFSQGDGYLRYFVAQDASYNALGFDVQQPGRYQQQLVDLSQTIGAMNPDLARYIARGGKLITLQGLADEVISPDQTIAYHDALVGRYGRERVDSFMRLYMVPGYQHGSGVFVPSVDLLGALDNWVTRGVAPETLVATDIAGPTNGRTRPLCRYPLFPRYVGKGDMNRASSFICAEP